MENITKDELKKIKGGFSAVGLAIASSALIAFIAGIIDGFVNPEPCGGDK